MDKGFPIIGFDWEAYRKLPMREQSIPAPTPIQTIPAPRLKVQQSEDETERRKCEARQAKIQEILKRRKLAIQANNVED